MTNSIDPDNSIELSISSKLQNVSAISLCAKSLSQYFGLNPEQIMQTELSVSEAVTNVIEHAYQNRPDQQVIMKIRKLGNLLEIQIFDNGIPLDKDRLASASSMFDDKAPDPLALMAESGRGLGLIQSMMDSVSVSVENGWNLLTMTKNI